MMRFPPNEIALKIALSLGIGLLVGLEREWAHKDLGVRTFTITALLGMLSALVGTQFAVASMIGVFIVIAFVNGRSLLNDRSLETTTSVALIATLILGVLVGQGHLFTPVASVIVMTMLLAWKTELRRFAGGLTPEEVRSAVLLGLLGFVVYPILPDGFVDRWQLINLRETWTTVVVIAGIGFANYVLLRLYSTKGLYYSAVLGGLINSTATVAETLLYLSGKAQRLLGLILPIVMLTITAMSIRNLLILVIFAREAIFLSVAPLLAMSGTAAFFFWRTRVSASDVVNSVKLSSPISLTRVLKFGLLFLSIEIAGALGQRVLGTLGFIAVSLIGGLVSSASTTAAAASMVTSGRLSIHAAAASTIIATVASAMVNIPLVYRHTKDRSVIIKLLMSSALLAAMGLGVLLLEMA